MPRPAAGKAFQEAFFRRYTDALSILELFEQLPFAYLYVKDTDSRFVKVNHGLISMLDLTSEEPVLGRTDRDFWPPVMAEAYIAEDRRVMAQRRPILHQTWLVPHIHGAPRWFVSSKIPLFGPDGRVLGIAGVMYPIEAPAQQRACFQELVPVLRHIKSRFAEPISMKKMASSIGLSTTHFNRRFRTLLRMSPSQYLLTLRVQEAQRLLTLEGMNLVDVALRCGFYDQSHFTKKFRRATGITPAAYRQKFR